MIILRSFFELKKLILFFYYNF